jgi:hypothetical protein
LQVSALGFHEGLHLHVVRDVVRASDAGEHRERDPGEHRPSQDGSRPLFAAGIQCHENKEETP